MPQFLLEILSEEIPARMQAGAARDLARLAREGLEGAGLAFAELRAFAGPRRLTLVVDGLPDRRADRTETRKGPRVVAPEAAMAGFLRSTGLTADQLEARDGVWFGVVAHPGAPAGGLLAAIAKGVIEKFPWPKSMAWADGAPRWVRPIRRILSLFDGAVAPFAIGELAAGDLTEGHRFMGPPAPFRVSSFEDYRRGLADRFVILAADDRKRLVLEGARSRAAATGLELIEDPGLLEEVAGMVEWPVPILGEFDPAYLTLPPEVVRTAMRVHQRYFALRRPGEEGLAARFLVVANIETPDGGALIAAGNGRVLAARLADARFFWDEDRKIRLADRLERLEGVTFHAKLGTMAERAARIAAAARIVAADVGVEPDAAALAGRLAKADLASGMVGEFPELQGIMGGHYAREEGLPAEVAAAIAEHYRPQGPSDAIPRAPLSVAVALADKLTLLIDFFAIGEAPTGSRDPFALRRAALGVIRIVLENRLRLPLRQAIEAIGGLPSPTPLLAFFADRLQVAWRDAGRRHDLAAAVLALEDDDLTRIADRMEALEAFLATPEGSDLIAAFRRADNILAAEARKGALPTGAPTRAASPPEEAALFDALEVQGPRALAALAGEDHLAALRGLAELRAPLDAFFDGVLVNSEVPQERERRLRLLAAVRALALRAADFGKVVG